MFVFLYKVMYFHIFIQHVQNNIFLCYQFIWTVYQEWCYSCFQLHVLQIDFHSDGDDKLFSKSARGLKGSHNLTGAWRNDSNLSNGASGYTPPEDRKEITSNTRSIAALAAKKRSKAHNDLLNLERQFGGEPRTLNRNSDNDYLSPSTLAKHDRNYGELVLPPLSKPPSEDNLDNISTGTKQSTNTDSTLPPLRNENNFRRGGDIRRNRRTRGYDVGYLVYCEAVGN